MITLHGHIFWLWLFCFPFSTSTPTSNFSTTLDELAGARTSNKSSLVRAAETGELWWTDGLHERRAVPGNSSGFFLRTHPNPPSLPSESLARVLIADPLPDIYREGALVRWAGDQIFLVMINGTWHCIPDKGVFYQRGWEFSEVILVRNRRDVDLVPHGEALPLPVGARQGKGAKAGGKGHGQGLCVGKVSVPQRALRNRSTVSCPREWGGKFKVLVVVTDSFFPVLVNWVHYYSQLCSLHDVFFLCFDAAENDKVERLLDRPCDVVVKPGVYNSPDLVAASAKADPLVSIRGLQSNAYVYRAFVGAQLLAKGWDVFMVDIDAFFLRSPWPTIDKLLKDGCDAIGTHGTFPEDIYKSFNTTLCTGLAYYKASPGMAALWSRVHALMQPLRRPDDQMLTNREVFTSRGLRVTHPWTPLDASGRTFQGVFSSIDSSSGNGSTINSSTINSSSSSSAVQSNSLRLALLPPTVVHRFCNASTAHTATIAHCYTGVKLKSTASKIHANKGIGLWHVRANWAKVWASKPRAGQLRGWELLNALVE